VGLACRTTSRTTSSTTQALPRYSRVFVIALACATYVLLYAKARVVIALACATYVLLYAKARVMSVGRGHQGAHPVCLPSLRSRGWCRSLTWSIRPTTMAYPPLLAALVCVCVECNASVLNMCARLAQTPDGMPSGSFGPTTAGRMDSYIDTFQKAGGSMVTLAKGNRSR
jgi:hypothetical protein